MLKRLVSTDELVAKKLYHNPFNFIPTHTLVLSTNHLPRVTSNDKGTWRRLVVVPFNATIAEKDTITDYMGLLYEQCGQNILQWCVDGARMFYEAGCCDKEQTSRRRRRDKRIP
jgi:phage/plasmid-associated DNA primase